MCARRENAVCAPLVRRVHAVNTLLQMLARRRSVMGALKTLWERRVDAEGLLWGRCVKRCFAATPQRADRFLERCTNDVASPFGVTGALDQALWLIQTSYVHCIRSNVYVKKTELVVNKLSSSQ